VWLVVGLGNPGRRYERTRHNIGFTVAERLAERWGIDPAARLQLGAEVGEGMISGLATVIARPQSFMNASGQPVASLAGYFRVECPRLVVIHDDMDLPFASVRCKRGGGHGGHNGLRDINRALGPDYLRVRAGVGRPPEGWDPASFVLGRWNPQEEAVLPEMVELACDAVECLLREGPEAAMNRFNVRPARGGGASEDPTGAASLEAPRSPR
jgi:PTH1 family peptidyl-tRNA hydrolase